MTNWLSDRWGFRLNKQMQEILEDEDFRKYLDREYDGKADFLVTKLREEKNQAPSRQERIEEKESQIEELVEEVEELKEKERKDQKKKELQEKKSELRDVQKKIKQIQGKDLKTEEEIREEVVEEFRDKAEQKARDSPKVDSAEEVMSKDRTQRRIESRVESRLKKQPSEEDLLELKKKATRLQEEVMELNGGESYDWFIDPQEAVEVQAI